MRWILVVTAAFLVAGATGGCVECIGLCLLPCAPFVGPPRGGSSFGGCAATAPTAPAPLDPRAVVNTAGHTAATTPTAPAPRPLLY